MPGTPLPVLPTRPGRATEPGRATPEQRAACPVVLVSMPFLEATRPSIQVGLLKEIAEAHGFPARTLHANLDFAALIGADYYRELAKHRGPLLGEWLFSAAAFGPAAPDPDGHLLDDFAAKLAYVGGTQAERRERLLTTRNHDIPAYLDRLVEEYPWHDLRVVGFTSTFQQNTPSFALARRLKARHPHLVTVFGGSNFDGEMGLELVGGVDCIDFAVIGEGDVAFPELLHALAAGSDPTVIPGVARKVGDRVVATPPAPPLRRLDDLPTPDYDEYFAHAEELGLLPPVGHRNVWIPFEAARGCWWGEKHHCTFCGLNGMTMQFRAKSPERVLAELSHQVRRHRSFHFEAVDNILDMSYLKKLLPVLVDSGVDYEFFYEVKANLSRAQLRLMAQAGLTRIQPGLESLNSHVLRLMRKGVRAAQNVNVLRWGRYYNIDVAWNMLWGFPGETKEDYAEQAAAVPHLWHLQPPSGGVRIWMERFSPLFDDRESFPLKSRGPEPSYRYIYPERLDLDRVAYFFEYELADTLPDSAYTDLDLAIEEWKAAWEETERPALTFWSAPGFVQIYDGRRKGQEGTYTFEGLLADIYLACSDRPVSASTVRERLGLDLPVEAVQEVFVEFQRRGLMFLDESVALALALPAVTGR